MASGIPVLVRDRTRLLRAASLIGLAAAALLLAAAGAAFACTGQASLHEITPASVQPGQMVTVSGNGYQQQRAVEVRLDRADGVLLTTATGTSFNVAVQIPESTPAGAHYIVAVAYDETGAVEDQDSRPFEVLAAEPEAPEEPVAPEVPSTPEAPVDSEPMTSTNPEQSTSNPQTPAPESSIPPPATDTAAPQIPAPEQPDTATAPEPATTTAPPLPAAPQPAQGQPVTPDVTRQPASPSSTDEPSPAASTQTSVATTSPAGDQPSGDDDAADAAAPAETSTSDATAQDETAAPPRTVRPDTDALAESAAPSPRTGSGDLWSGLGTDEGGLTSGFDAPATSRSGGTAGQVALAAGLLGAGLIVLVAAGTTLAVRRRRVRVGAHGAPDQDA